MTLKRKLRRNDYNGDGVTTTFAVSFPFADATHLRVVLTDLKGGYRDGVIVAATVSGQGGTVTLDHAPALGVPVAILGATPLTQDADFSAGVSGPVLEAALDKITMQQQEQDETLGRTFRVPPGYPGPDLTLPAPVPGRGLKFDAAGKLVLTQGDMDTQVTGATPSAVVHADRVAVGRVNDYRAGNSARADILQLARSSDFDLTGIADGTDGKELRVQCTGGGDVTLKHNSPHSAAGNRIWLSPSAYPAGEVKLQPGDTATLLYMRYNVAVGKVWVLTGVTQAQAPEATTSVKGVVKFATQAEAQAGIATDKAMTPALVKAALMTLGSGGGGLQRVPLNGNKLMLEKGVSYLLTVGEESKTLSASRRTSWTSRWRYSPFNGVNKMRVSGLAQNLGSKYNGLAHFNADLVEGFLGLVRCDDVGFNSWAVHAYVTPNVSVSYVSEHIRVTELHFVRNLSDVSVLPAVYKFV